MNFGEMPVQGVKGGLDRGMFQHYVFPVTTVTARVIYMPNDPIHHRENEILGSSAAISLDGEEIEPFVKLVTVVSYATVGAGGYWVFRASLLKEPI